VAEAAAVRRGHAPHRRPGRLPQQLTRFVYQTGMFMQPVLRRARGRPAHKRVAYAEGEDERVLRAVQVVVDEGWRAPS
jgi:malate dehydrogenase (oxaloacetate-decarboxylating)(NADP+)